MSFGLGFGYPKVVKSGGGGGVSYSFLSSVPTPFSATGGSAGAALWTYYNSTPSLTNSSSGLTLFDYFPATSTPKGMFIGSGFTSANLPYTEDFTQTAWVKTGSTVTAAATTSTRNTTTGQKLSEDATTGVHQVSANTFGVTSGFGQFISIQAKAAERNWLQVAASATNYAYFNLSTGAVGTVVGGNASIYPLFGGWYQCYFWATASAATPSATFAVASADNTNSYAGTAGNGLYILATQTAQLNTFNPNLIATYFYNNTAAQASIFQSDVSATPTALGLSPNSGAVVVECVANGGGGNAFGFSDGTAANGIFISSPTALGVVSTKRVVANVTSQTTATVTWTPTTVFKIGVSWNTTTLLLSVNGGTVSSVAATGALGAMTTAKVMSFLTGSYGHGDSWIRNLTVYGAALTSLQLQSATV